MNVIVIVADTWRFDYLGCYGNDWIQTPHVDRLAETPLENELYDRREDPFQLRNLAAEMPDRSAEMHRRLRDFMIGLKTG